MFLQKGEDLLTQKQMYLIKYLFGDHATKTYKDLISVQDKQVSALWAQKRDLLNELD